MNDYLEGGLGVTFERQVVGHATKFSHQLGKEKIMDT